MLRLSHRRAWFPKLLAACLLLRIPVTMSFGAGALPAEISIDCGRTNGELRPLHGANFGPLCANGTVDLTPFHRELALPSVRLHDIPWTYGEVVDIHTIFRDFRADPADPASYDFRRTDDYLAAVIRTGARVVFRLGESIEHTPRKYWVHPPADFAKWAQVCAGVIRHYNEGWAGGFHHGIRDWEIWNEPENQPASWTGSDEDYFRLYEVTARTLKSRWPELRIGGPAVGNTGRLANGVLEPSRFLTNFLAFCRDRRLPLDFFSWHCYADDPREFVVRANEIRRLLDGHGFSNTPSHLNEWNYLPRGDWGPMLSGGQGRARERMFDEVGGPAGAAFSAATLLRLQDAPVEMANLFSADNQGFGLFTPAGTPRKNYHAVRAFRLLLETPVRIEVTNAESGPLTVAAGKNRKEDEVRVLLSSSSSTGGRARLQLRNLPWSKATVVETLRLDAALDLTATGQETLSPGKETFAVDLPAPGVLLVQLRPAAKN